MIDAYATNTLRYEPALCNGCAMCMYVCPHAVFALENGRARLERPRDCMECGACQLNCPTNALKVDAGVGCAEALMWAALTGRREACRGGDTEPACCGGSE